MLGTQRSRRALVLLGATALAAILVAVLALGGSRRTAASGLSRPPLESIFEAEGLLHANPGGTLDTFRRLGVTRVRVYLTWGTIAPDSSSPVRPSGFDGGDPAAYPAANWAIYDAIVRAAHARGVGLDFTIGGPAPLWANTPGAPPGTPYPVWEPSASDYGAFMRAVATRYSGHYTPAGQSSPLPRVKFWAIWNEPNYGPELAPQAVDDSTVEVSPRYYRALVDAAWAALQATGHGHDTILIGELAPRGITTGNSPGNFSGMVPLRFVRALYCVDSGFHQLQGAAAAVRGCPTTAQGSAQFRAANPALFDASGFSDHPYPQGQVPPDVATPFEPDYADLPALPNLERTLDRVQAIYGSSTRFPIYSTEFGYQTNPPEKIARAINPQTAAYYLNWSEYISWRDPRVRSYDQYLLVDPPNANALSGFATGLEFKDGTPKATYYAYRMPLYLPVTASGTEQALEVWGCVRPAHYASIGAFGRAGAGVQTAQIQFQRGALGPFRTLERVPITDPDGYFDVHLAFPASGSVRVAWSYPRGPTIYSRVVSVSIR